MKNLSSLFITILVSTCILGQSESYDFSPEWKTGDQRLLTITQTEKEFEDDKLKSDTTFVNEATLTVIEETDTSYTLEVIFENQALRALSNFDEKVGANLAEYKDLTLLYSINKETANRTLLNWQDPRDFMLESFDAFGQYFEEKSPDEAFLVELVLAPIKNIFESKENIEVYMESTIGYLFVPYDYSFSLGETIVVEQSEENPFNPSKNVSSKTLTTLTELNNNSAVIEQEIELDLSEFKEMIKNMIVGMMESAGAADSTNAKKSEEFDNFEMDMTNLSVITYNRKTTWVENSVNTGEVISTDPRTGLRSRKVVVVEAVIQ